MDFEGIAVDNTRLPSDITGAGASRQRRGDAVVEAPSARRTSLSYGAPTVGEDATRASTMKVAVSVAPPTKSCAMQRSTIAVRVSKTLNTFSSWLPGVQ